MTGHNEWGQYFNGKKILVTGATGYLGSAVCESLKAYRCTVTALKGDIRHQEWKHVLNSIDMVYHFAAQTSTYAANENPLRDAEINVLPAASLIEACLKFQLRPDIIFSGTVTQAGMTPHVPIDESYKDAPVTMYDIHKLTVEHYLRFYTQAMKGRAVTLRLANLYGPGPSPRSNDRGVLNKMVEKALRGEPLSIYGKGDCVRDYIFIDDVVRAFLVAGSAIGKLNGGYYVIGSGQGHTIAQMAQAVAQETKRMTGKTVEIKHVPAPEGLSAIEFRNFIADSKSFESLTAWKALVDFKEGVRRTAEALNAGIQAGKT